MRLRTALIVVASLALGVFAGRLLPSGSGAGGSSGSAQHAHADATSTSRPAPAGTVWTCSMHPQIRQAGPGECPLCGMDLIPTAAADDDPQLSLSEEAQRVASIEVAPVVRRVLVHELRAVGRIEFAEPLVAYLSARVAARVERVYADFTGTAVAAGDHLVDLYSPELVLAQQELLVAGPNAGAARQKLLLLGVTEEQIEQVLAERRLSTVLTLHAPIGGTVIEKSVREQMYVEVGDPLYTIADLSTVWMFADIFEIDLPWVAVGQPVDVSLEGAPGERFAGTVAFIEPVVREATRTVRVRVNLPNPEGRLRPGMFAKAVIRAELGGDARRAPSPLAGKWTCPMHPDIARDEPGDCPLCGMDLQRVAGEASAAIAPDAAPVGLLAVPTSAVLDSGLRQIVWLERKPGTYAAVEVRLGPRAGGYYPVLDGLDEGERVVVRGNFLIDSQAQIEGRPSLLLPHGIQLPRDGDGGVSADAGEGDTAGHGAHGSHDGHDGH